MAGGEIRLSELPPVPLVGQPCVVHAETAAIMVTLTCKCHQDNTPVFLRGADVAAACMRCGNIYQIVAASYDIRNPTQGLPSVGVAVMGNHRADIKVGG